MIVGIRTIKGSYNRYRSYEVEGLGNAAQVVKEVQWKNSLETFPKRIFCHLFERCFLQLFEYMKQIFLQDNNFFDTGIRVSTTLHKVCCGKTYLINFKNYTEIHYQVCLLCMIIEQIGTAIRCFKNFLNLSTVQSTSFCSKPRRLARHIHAHCHQCDFFVLNLLGRPFVVQTSQSEIIRCVVRPTAFTSVFPRIQYRRLVLKIYIFFIVKQ